MTDLKLIWREAMAREAENNGYFDRAQKFREGLHDSTYPALSEQSLAIYTDLVCEGWEPEAAVDPLVAALGPVIANSHPGDDLRLIADHIRQIVRAEEQAKAHEALTFIADLPDPGEEQERSATFYRIHIANLKHIAAKALGRQTVSDEALAWAEEQAKAQPAECPSCQGMNTSCPDGCGRDPLTGELDGTRLAQPAEAETYRQMHATALELGYEDILDALEALAELKNPAQPTDHDDPMEVAREALEKSAIRLDLCAQWIEQSFQATGTLRTQRAMKARHMAQEAREALARVLPPMRIADLGEVKP